MEEVISEIKSLNNILIPFTEPVREDCTLLDNVQCENTKMIIRNEAIKWIRQMEKDFSDESDKPLLKPKNNREYWLFTEQRQRFMDFFNFKEEDLK